MPLELAHDEGKEGNRIGKREKLGSNVISTEAPGSTMGNFEDAINLRAVPAEWEGQALLLC